MAFFAFPIRLQSDRNTIFYAIAPTVWFEFPLEQ